MASEITVGIDLASRAASTALCAIAWTRSGASIVRLERGRNAAGNPLNDQVLLAAIESPMKDGSAPSKVAIDAPLGWPQAFVEGIASPTSWPVDIDDIEGRRRVLRRETDHWVEQHAKKQPLSVSSDKIAYPAMRAAGLLTHYAHATGTAPDRSGTTGRFCEAYPDPSIRSFGLWPQGVTERASYKGGAGAGVRSRIVKVLRGQARWLTITDAQAELLVETDDHLDALICALVARACQRGQTVGPPTKLEAAARAEGWIHLPCEKSLSQLI